MYFNVNLTRSHRNRELAPRAVGSGAGADFTAHTWPGGHERSYWDRHWNAYLHFYASALARCAGAR